MCEKTTNPAWCQECGITYFKNNFSNWTSGNQKIDEIIKETQMNSKFPVDFVEWIPPEQLEQVKKINQGGFATVYSAFWKQDPISMFGNEFKRTKGIQVALKSAFLQKIWKRSPVLRCYGLTKRPEDAEKYMLVMQYVRDSDLQNYLSKNINRMSWFEAKLPILASIANGLKIIHKEDTKDKEIFGMLPFIAPEIINGQPYSQKSDVYSFGIIMWMFTSGSLPFHNREYDLGLQFEIFNGIRPQIIDGTPPCFINLMKKCWDPKPENRPDSSEIYNEVCSWYYLKNYKEFKASDKILLSQDMQNIEHLVAKNTSGSFLPLHLNRQNNCRNDLKPTSAASQFRGK
ncbi:kinase-like domain-containing protein [Gigaspora rosea]|uniref:Kinase-like domain-containing protein n=1 Tax=Gigaspora rosea TaxID=44941 RepID=A0A397VNA0_9GLOM|nr:kinase-like domain-containing protein [Gigaspora rosea]